MKRSPHITSITIKEESYHVKKATLHCHGPVTGYFTREIVASSKKEAFNLAVNGEDGFSIFDPQNKDCLGEFEYHDAICTGNVFHGVINEAEIELSEDQDDLEE